MAGAVMQRTATLFVALTHFQLVCAFAPPLQHGLSVGLRAAARPALVTALVRPRGASPAHQPAALAAEARASLTEASPSLLTSVVSNAATVLRAVATALFTVLAVAVFSLQALIGLREMAATGAAQDAAAAASKSAIISKADEQQGLESSQSKATLAITVVSGAGFIANGYMTLARLSKVSRRHG